MLQTCVYDQSCYANLESCTLHTWLLFAFTADINCDPYSLPLVRRETNRIAHVKGLLL